MLRNSITAFSVVCGVLLRCSAASIESDTYLARQRLSGTEAGCTRDTYTVHVPTGQRAVVAVERLSMSDRNCAAGMRTGLGTGSQTLSYNGRTAKANCYKTTTIYIEVFISSVDEKEEFVGWNGNTPMLIWVPCEHYSCEGYYDLTVTYEDLLPDLEIASMAFQTAGELMSDESQTLKYSIVNKGHKSAASSVASVYHNGSPVTTVQVPALAEGASFSGTCDFAPLAPGEHSFSIRVSPVNEEVVLDNNEKTLTVRSYARTRYLVRFDAHGGVGTMTDQPFVFGTRQNLRANAFSRENFVFRGWSRAPGGSVDYEDRQLVGNLDLDVDGIETLYAVWQEANTKDVRYTVANGEVTITGVWSSFSGELVIPSVLEGLPVTRIDEKAFYGNDKLTAVFIPAPVTEIGPDAFYSCKKLESVALPPGLKSLRRSSFSHCTWLGSLEIPEGVTAIGTSAFYRCDSLESLTIPSSVREIGDGAFQDSGLTNVTIKSGVTNICTQAFYSCTSLKSIVLPEGVEILGSSVFSNCRSLESVSLPSSLREFDSGFVGMFSSCYSLDKIELAPGSTSFTLVDGVLYDKGVKTLVACPGAREKALLVPEGVTRIAEHACAYCNNLTSIHLPSTLNEIGVKAFMECRSLRELALHPGVRVLDFRAFADCVDCTSVIFRGNAPETMGEDVFKNTPATIYASRSSTGWGGDVPCSWGDYYVNALPAVYLVRYDFWGGEPGRDAPDFMMIGKHYPLSEPVREGYVFAGWTVTSGIDPSLVEFGDLSCKIDSSATGGGEVTLTAKWVAASSAGEAYDVRFLPGSGSGAAAVLDFKRGCVRKLPANSFTPPAGKRFAGWACSNGRRYNDGMLVFNLAQPGETVTMTAIWE